MVNTVKMFSNAARVPLLCLMSAFIIVTGWFVLHFLRDSTVRNPVSAQKENVHRVVILLEQVENKNIDLSRRVDAAEELREFGKDIQEQDETAVSRLIELLPGDWDALTLQIVLILREVGDRRAVPKLQAMEHVVGVNVHSRIRIAIESTLKTLQETNKDPT